MQSSSSYGGKYSLKMAATIKPPPLRTLSHAYVIIEQSLISFQSNTKITALNVSNNDLGSKGVIYLAELIAENIFINKLVELNC